MKIPGKSKEKQEYLNGINEQEFVYLVGDILSFHFEHTDIKIMDGTGDGKRDIYSVNKNGQKHLTQCKFHKDISKTCGTNETDELPIGLLKFGYNVGCFATSSKISPQSKREYLENYKDFEISWLEGIEIVEKVFEINLLKRIWFNGEKISKTTNSISIPFIVRNMKDDYDIEIDESYFSQIFEKFNISKKRFPLKQFGNYRKSEKKDKYHNLINGTSANVIELNNYLGISQILDFKTKVSDSIRQSYSFYKDEIISVRFGYPFLSEIINSSDDELFNLPISCETFILSRKTILKEYDWLIKLSPQWILPSRCRASMLDNFSFLNKNNDINLQINYKSIINDENNAQISLQIDFLKLIWKKSIFIYGSTKNVDFFIKETHLSPEQQYYTEPNSKIICWFHPRPFIYSASLDEVEKQLFDEKFEQLRIYIKDTIRTYNVDEVTSEFAQKIAEINEPNLFNKNLINYRTIDIFDEYKEILSPINPKNRSFIFRKVWKIKTIDSLENIIEKVNKLFKKYDCEFYIDYSYKTNHVEYIIVYLGYKYNKLTFLSSQEVIDMHIDKPLSIFKAIESEILKYFEAISYTKKYLYEEMDISF